MANIFIKAAVMVVADVVGSVLGAPPPVYGPRMLNRGQSFSTYGNAIERCRGTVRCTGNVIWSTRIFETIYKSVHGLFGSSAVYTYQYSVSLAVAFARGPAVSLQTLSTDGKRLFSARSTNTAVRGIVNVDATFSNPVQQGSLQVPIITGANSSAGIVQGAGIMFPEDPAHVYEVQADLVLGANETGIVSIWPPLFVTLIGPNSGAGPVPYTDARYNITAPGSTGNLLDSSAFSVDQQLGHPTGPTDPRTQTGGGFVFYPGSSTQLPDPTMEEYDGVGNVPGYRDLVYVMITNLQLANFGNRIPNFTAEIVFDTGVTAATYTGPVPGAFANQIVIPGHLAEPGMPGSPSTPYVIAFVTGNPGVNMYRINAISGVVEATGELHIGGAVLGAAYVDWFACAGADNDGYLYTVAPSGLNQWVLTKFSYITMQIVSQIGPGFFGEPKGPIHLLDVPNSGPNGTTEKLVIWSDYFGGMTVVDRERMVILGQYGGQVQGITSDALGHFWIFDGTTVSQMAGVLSYTTQQSTGNTQTQATLTGVDLSVLLTIDVSGLGFGQPSGILYWLSANALVVCFNSGVALIDCGTGSVTGYGTVAFGNPLGISASGQLVGDSFVTVQLASIDGPNSTIISSYQSIGSFGIPGVTSPDVWAYDPDTNSVWIDDHGTGFVYRLYLGRSAASSVDVGEAIDWLCAQSDLAITQYDTSQITGLYFVDGVQYGQQTLRESILLLMQVYQIDGIESDGRILFLRRDRVPTVEIQEDDLGALESTSKKEPRLIEVMQKETDTPERISLVYYDNSKQFQPAVQYAKRISRPYSTNAALLKGVTNSRNQLTLTLPVTNNPSRMKQQAEKLLFEAWASRMSYTFKAMWKFLRLDPGDIIQIAYRGNVLESRLTQADRGAGLALQYAGVSHDSGVYTSIAVTSSGPGGSGGSSGASGSPPGGTGGGGGGSGQPGQNPPPAIVPIQLLLSDSPLLEDVDADAGAEVYFGLGSVGPAWSEGVVYRSTDDVDFNEIASRNVAALWGQTTTVLGDPAALWVFDNSTTVTIKVIGTSPSVLAGTSDANITTNHANLAALLKRNGEVELFQFGNVVDNGDGTFTLSHLVRGVRGTDTMSKGHTLLETFVLLDGAQGRFVVPLADRELVRYYKAIPSGAATTGGQVLQLTLHARTLMPYAPYLIGGYIDANANIIVTWARRTRIGAAQWVSGINGPLSEERELYEVDIYSGVNVVRTLRNLTTPAAAYLAADQVTDFGSHQSSITVKVYQISATVGRGFPGSGVVPFANGIPAVWPQSGGDYINGA